MAAGSVHALRVYADTSVYGGCFDTGFESSSRRLFEEIRGGVYRLIVSDVVLRELVHEDHDD